MANTNIKQSGVDLSEIFNSYNGNSDINISVINDPSANSSFKSNGISLFQKFKFRAINYGNEPDVSYNYQEETFDTGKNWVSTYNSVKEWTCVACSYTGQYVVAAAWQDNIYYSDNYGVSWTISNGSPQGGAYRAICMDASGKFAYCSLSPNSANGVYYSHNFGVTWAKSALYPENINSQLMSISCSANGRYIIFSANVGTIYVSDNYGLSFGTAKTLNNSYPIVSEWFVVKMSGNGKYALAASSKAFFYNGNTNYSGRIFYSDTYGTTWSLSQAPTDKVWSSVSMSHSGQYAIATDYNGNTPYWSNTYGKTWAQVASGNPTSTEWIRCSMSYTGQYCLYVRCNLNRSNSNIPQIYYSDDYGQNIKASTYTLNTQQYDHCICISGNGRIGYFNALIVGIGAPNANIIYKSIWNITKSIKNLKMAFEPLYTHSNAWTLANERMSIPSYSCCAMSSSYQNTIAIVGTSNNAGLYYSSDNGLNWSPTSIQYGNISSCAINCSATNAIASIYNGKIYYSTNLTTYTASNSPDLSWVDVSISNGNSFYVNGAVLACACTSNYNTGIYYSNDSGITWNEITVTRRATSTYTSVHISSNGYYVVATPSYGKIIINEYWWDVPYINDNLSYVESNSPVRNWSSVAMSDDGQWGVACAKVPTVYELGNYTIGPWGLSAYPKLNGAKWIWNSPTAATPGFEPSQFIWFYSAFAVVGINQTVTVTTVVDNIGFIYIDNTYIGLSVFDSPTTYAINRSLTVGTHSIRVLCRNMNPYGLNPAGLIVSIVNASSGNPIFGSNASMSCRMANFKTPTVYTKPYGTYGGGLWLDYSNNNVTSKLVNTDGLSDVNGSLEVLLPVTFYKRFWWNGVSKQVILYVQFDDVVQYISFNNENYLNSGWTNWNKIITLIVYIRNGENIISVTGYNNGGFGVFGAALWDGTTHIMSSDSSWYYVDYTYETIYNTLYRTNDYGRTWAAVVNAPRVSYNKVAVSSTGQYGLATIDGAANMLYTKDYGENWSEVGQNIGGISSPQWGAVALSGTGKYALAGLIKYNIYSTGFLYYSRLNDISYKSPTYQLRSLNNINYHVWEFLETGKYMFTLGSYSNPAYALLVGGGGGGGVLSGAGGGGGGVMDLQLLDKNKTYIITVGKGGFGMDRAYNLYPSNGENTSIVSDNTIIVAYGGGGGGGWISTITFNFVSSNAGGSSAGRAPSQTLTGGFASGQGNQGGISVTSSTLKFAGGGGGAGGVGGNAISNSKAGNGGNGIQCLTGRETSPPFYGGGGGGSGDGMNGTFGIAGSGGGGNGSFWGENGTPNTGGGGGGGGILGDSVGGNGGSGRVVISVQQ